MSNSIQSGFNEPSQFTLREVATREEFVDRWKSVLEAPSISLNVLLFLIVSLIAQILTLDNSGILYSAAVFINIFFIFRIVYSLVVWHQFYTQYISIYGPKFRNVFSRRNYLLSYFGFNKQQAKDFKPNPFWLLKRSTLPLPVLSQGLNILPPLTQNIEIRTKEEFLDRWNSRLLAPSLPIGWTISIYFMSLSGNLFSITKDTPFYGLALLFGFIVFFGFLKTIYSSIRWIAFIIKHKEAYGTKLLNLSRHKHELQKHFGLSYREVFEYRMTHIFSDYSSLTSRAVAVFPKNRPSGNESAIQSEPDITLPISYSPSPFGEIPDSDPQVIIRPGLSYGTPIDMRVVNLNNMDPQNNH